MATASPALATTPVSPAAPLPPLATNADNGAEEPRSAPSSAAKIDEGYNTDEGRDVISSMLIWLS